MSLAEYAPFCSEEINLLAVELAKQELPRIVQLEPIADFEELITFAESHPTPIEFVPSSPAWRLESVAARVIEAVAIAAHEPLTGAEWQELTRILLEHAAYLYTYPDTPTNREKLEAGTALALVGSVCASLSQSELWRLAGFGRIAAALSEGAPVHVIQLLDIAFSLANERNLPILNSAIARYNTVLNRPLTFKHRLGFPLNDTDFFDHINLEFADMDSVKSAVLTGDIAGAKSAYTAFRQRHLDHLLLEKTDTYRTAKSYLQCLLQLSINPSPPIAGTTELGIAALLFPEFRGSEQLLSMALRRYKWITDTLFYPDGFHIDTSLRSQVEAVADFVRFLSVYDSTAERPHAFQGVENLKTLLEKQVAACISISQPDLSFPPFGTSPIPRNFDVVELCQVGDIGFERDDFLYIASAREQGNEPKTTSHALPYVGYYAMRDCWSPKAQYLLFDTGPLGKPGYEDKLSFVLHAHGRQLITHNHQDRHGNADSTASQAHNSLHIDGKGQSRAQQAEAEIIPDADTRWLTTSAFDFVEGWYKTTDFQHKRSIFYVKGAYFVLHDVVLGERERTLSQIFHLNTFGAREPVIHVAANVGHAWTQEIGQSNIFIGAVDTTDLRVQSDAKRLTYNVQRKLPAVLNTLLLPMKPHVEERPTLLPIAVSTDADVLATGFSVELNGVTDTFLISDDGLATMSTTDMSEKIEFIGEYLFLRGDTFVMLNARFLKVGAQVLAALDEPRAYHVGMRRV